MKTVLEWAMGFRPEIRFVFDVLGGCAVALALFLVAAVVWVRVRRRPRPEASPDALVIDEWTGFEVARLNHPWLGEMEVRS